MKRENSKKKFPSISPIPPRTLLGRASGLLDGTFWKFLSGFVLVLIVSLSLLAVVGVWREAAENLAQLIQMFQR